MRNGKVLAVSRAHDFNVRHFFVKILRFVVHLQDKSFILAFQRLDEFEVHYVKHLQIFYTDDVETCVWILALMLDLVLPTQSLQPKEIKSVMSQQHF